MNSAQPAYGRVLVLTIFTACGGVVGLPAFAQQFQDQTAARFPTQDPLEYTNQVTVGDLNGDGHLDIVWANGGDYSTPGTPQKLRIYINDGTGHFTDETDARTGGLTFLARGVELGDVDGDGDLDIVVAQDFNRIPALLINDGKGNFTNETAIRLPQIPLSSSRVQLADVDNDGDLDLYFTNGGSVNRWGSGQGKLYINDGNGFFTDETAARMPAGNISEPMDAIFGDIDGDFDLDLRIASTANNQSKMYRNNGAGIFTAISMPADQNCSSYDFGDIDNNGTLDLFGVNGDASGSNTEVLFTNDGSGAFFNASSQLLTNPFVIDSDSKFFDYDNDGDLDLIVARIGGPDRIYINNGIGFFSVVPDMMTPITNSSLDVEVADFNGDGRLDIVTAQGESGDFTNRIYINVTGPADTIPPNVLRTEQLSNTADTTGPYAVRAAIFDSHTSDRGFHSKGVYLNYSVNGQPMQQVPMRWVGNSLWRGEIPGQDHNSTISYFVTALDFNNNEGVGETRSFNILPAPCPGDVTGDRVVNVDDLLTIIGAWGQTTSVVDVGVAGFSFVPATVKARTGDTVRWTQISGFHTVTSGSDCTPDGMFNAPITNKSPIFEYVIPADAPANIPYYCLPHCHFGMVGMIEVEPFAVDTTGDGVVNVDDLLLVIGAWGTCP